MLDMQNGHPKQTLSTLGALALAFGCIIGWGSFVMPGASFLPNAGPLGTAIAMVLGAICMSLIAYNYRFMMERHPVSGGAFVYAKETFGRRHGFICGWMLLISFVSLVAQNASALTLIGRNLMNHFASFGFSYSIAGFDMYFGEVVLVLAALGVVALIISRSTKITYLLQGIFVICMIVFIILSLGMAFSNPLVDPINIEPAFNPDKPAAFGVLAVFSLVPWAFVGFDVLSQTADEFKFPVKRAGIIMVVAIAMGAVFYLATNALASSVVPAGFDSWVDYVAATQASTGIVAIPVFNALYMLFGNYGIILLDVGTLGAVLTGVIGFYVASVRLLTAMGDSGELPDWLCETHPKHGTPIKAIVLVLAVTVVLSLLGRSVLAWIVDMSSIGAAAAFLYTSAASFKVGKAEGAGLATVLGIIGIVLSVVFFILLLLPVEQIGAHLQIQSILFLIAWAALGFNFYNPRRKKPAGLAIGERLTAIDSKRDSDR